MSVESQAILSGHVPVDRIVSLLQAELSGSVTVRDMQRPEYKVIEFQKVDGSWATVNLFLESWAADDYAGAFTGPSTFLTTEYSPHNFKLVRSIAAGIGGLVRKTQSESWAVLKPAAI